MESITAVGYVLRPIRAFFFFDERPLAHISSSLIHGCTSIVRTIPCAFLFISHQLDPENPLSFEHHPHTSRNKHTGQRGRGPCPPPSLAWLTTNGTLPKSSSLYQRFHALSPHRQNPRSPTVNVSLLSHLSTGSGNHTILTLYPGAHSCPDMHPCQRQTDACSVPPRNVPRAGYR